MNIETIDLNFLGTEHVIASFLLIGDDSAAIVETGPTTCLDELMGGLKTARRRTGGRRTSFPDARSPGPRWGLWAT